MSSPNINVILQALMVATANAAQNAPQIANFDFANPTLGATTIYYEPYFQAAQGGGSNVPLPVTTVFIVAVQNLATSGTLTVRVSNSQTPQVGVFAIGPQGVFIFLDPSENVGGGINGVTLIGGTAVNPCMVLVGA